MIIRARPCDSLEAKPVEPGGLPVKEFIARENIRRFETRLAACTDPEQRETLERLLGAERRRLKEARVKGRTR